MLKQYKHIFFLFVGSRAVIFLLGHLSTSVIPKGRYFGPIFYDNIFCRWDCGWYLNIAIKGYGYTPELHSNVAFFPLLPLLIGLLDFANPFLAGYFISNISLLLACCYLYNLIRIDYDKSIAFKSVVFVLIWPMSLYFSIIYTEGLFLFLSIASFYYMRKQKWWHAGIFGFFASLTRETGVLLLIPMFLEYIREKKGSVRADAGSILLIPLGLLVFMSYLFFKFGNPFVSILAHKAWGTGFVFPWETIREIINYKIPVLAKVHFLAFLLFSIIMVGYLIHKNVRFSLVAYSAGLIALYLCSNAVLAIPRLVSIIFPLFLGMALLSQKRTIRFGMIVFSTSYLILITVMYVNGYWLN